MTGKGLLAIGLAVIAGVFLALVIQARTEEKPLERSDEAEREEDSLQQFGECEEAVDRAVLAAGDRVEEMFGTGARRRVKDIAARRCQEDAWPPEVIECLRGADDASALSRCIGQLHPDAHRQLMAELERIPRDGSLTDPWPSNPGGTLAGNSDGPPDCVEYGRLIEKFANCDKVPAATRDALKQSFDQMKQAWMNLPASSWDTMGTACKQGSDALSQALATMCP